MFEVAVIEDPAAAEVSLDPVRVSLLAALGLGSILLVLIPGQA